MSKSFQISLAVTLLSVGSVFASEFSEVNQEPLFEQNIVVQNEMTEKTMCPPAGCPPMSDATVPCEPMVLLPSQPCPQNWRVLGEFLYLLPTLDDTYFVLNSGLSTTFPNGKRENNDFGFKPGFRVGAEFACCNSHRTVQALYSRLSASENRTVTGSHLWATLGRPDLTGAFENYSGSASSELKLLYQNAELNCSHQMVNSHGTYLYIQPGVEFGYFRLKEEYNYQTESALGSIDQQSKVWGVGPQLGIGLDYSIYQGKISCSTVQSFSMTSLFSGGILMSRGMTKNVQTLGTVTQLSMQDELTWRTIPALRARVGLNYLIHASKFGFAVGIGYEFNTYVRALSRVNFTDDVADGLCNTEYYNFDIQGLYVSGAFSF